VDAMKAPSNALTGPSGGIGFSRRVFCPGPRNRVGSHPERVDRASEFRERVLELVQLVIGES
jgi:hypothetical protein